MRQHQQQQQRDATDAKTMKDTDDMDVEMMQPSSELMVPSDEPRDYGSQGDVKGSPGDDDTATEKELPAALRGLTGTEIWNLTFALLAWACTASTVTIVVGTSAVVLLSVGGDSNLTSLPLGTFMFGSSLVSLLVTPWLFVKTGRKGGFLWGIGTGLVGTALGCASIAVQSPALLVTSTICFGASMGIGFFLRFAAVELVPPHWRAKAVTLVVSGGVLAAFAGPESAQGTKDLIGGEDMEYMGTFIMTGVFNLANALFTMLISFPPTTDNNKTAGNVNNGSTSSSSLGDEQPQKSQESAKKQQQQDRDNRTALLGLLKTRQFLVPMLVAAIAWAAMAMPMSIVRVVMKQVGFSSRQSLTTIETHFLGMYSPGFITGTLISHLGSRLVAAAGIVVFGAALAMNFLAPEASDDDSGSDMVLWAMGLFCVGVAWNFCFTSATVWTTALYHQSPDLKPLVQAANDFFMFLLSGAWIVSASYVFEAGGSELQGWDVLNWVVFGLVGLMGLIIAFDWVIAQQQEHRTRSNQ